MQCCGFSEPQGWYSWQFPVCLSMLLCVNWRLLTATSGCGISDPFSWAPLQFNYRTSSKISSRHVPVIRLYVTPRKFNPCQDSVVHLRQWSPFWSFFQFPPAMACSLLVKLPPHGVCHPLPTCPVWRQRTKATIPTSRSFPKTAQDGQANRNKQTQRGKWPPLAPSLSCHFQALTGEVNIMISFNCWV